MNDKDKEAFDVWVWDNFNLTYELNPSQYDDLKDSWQAACEYKQREIDSIDCYIERDEKIKKLQAELLGYKEAASSEAVFVNELQVENKKLRECVEFYADLSDEVSMYDSRGVSDARQCLKELENK